MKYPQKYGSAGNSRTYSSDTAMLYIIKTQKKGGQRDASSLPKKGHLGIAKNCRGITITPIAAKIYSVQSSNHIEPKI